ASAPETVTAFPLPTVPVITRVNDTLISTPSAGYQWYFNNTILDGSTDPTLTITQNGNYYVEVSDTNGCTNQSAQFNVTSVGIADITVTGNVKLYPNPNTGSFVLEFTTATEREIEINDITGKVVVHTSSTSMRTDITTNLSKGIYLLRVKQNHKYATLRFAVTN
ncbi:MAG: hypothetical protein RLZZ367_1585, partial [Bacteroidota bacterium]